MTQNALETNIRHVGRRMQRHRETLLYVFGSCLVITGLYESSALIIIEALLFVNICLWYFGTFGTDN